MTKTAHDVWMEQYEEATRKFEVVGSGWVNGAASVIAEADTGSIYAVSVSLLPPTVASRLGGKYLISVMQPWQGAYPVGHLGPHYGRYLPEKFLPRAPEQHHGGDVAALVETIGRALALFGETQEEVDSDD